MACYEVIVRQFEPGGVVVREQILILQENYHINANVVALAWAYGRWGKDMWLDTIIKELEQ